LSLFIKKRSRQGRSRDQRACTIPRASCLCAIFPFRYLQIFLLISAPQDRIFNIAVWGGGGAVQWLQI